MAKRFKVGKYVITLTKHIGEAGSLELWFEPEFWLNFTYRYFRLWVDMVLFKVYIHLGIEIAPEEEVEEEN